MTAITADAGVAGRPWRRAALWLACLGPFFYLSYGLANWLASVRSDVGAVVFGWEHALPFWAWSIVPYWSINGFYAASLFVCTSRLELDTHGRRLLTAQVLAVACFLAVPLRFTFVRPDTGGGLPGFLFDALAGFDKPFNQAPSLHIALLVILWPLYARHVPRWALRPLHAWFALIGLSVLTTYQHHFLDVPTGALLGLLCLWLWPDGGGFALARRPPPGGRAGRLALAYGVGAILFAAGGLALGGFGLWLLYPAMSLAIVALAYARLGPQAFQKRDDGRVSLASRLLFAPYRAGAWLNAWAWTRGEPPSAPVASGVHLGRLPQAADKAGGTIIDVAAELAPPRAARVRAFPALDLLPPSPELLRAAADATEHARAQGPVLVCCALGYSRSAAVAATWLLRSGRAESLEQALALLRRARPKIVVGPALQAAIAQASRAT